MHDGQNSSRARDEVRTGMAAGIATGRADDSRTR